MTISGESHGLWDEEPFVLQHHKDNEFHELAASLRRTGIFSHEASDVDVIREALINGGWRVEGGCDMPKSHESMPVDSFNFDSLDPLANEDNLHMPILSSSLPNMHPDSSWMMPDAVARAGETSSSLLAALGELPSREGVAMVDHPSEAVTEEVLSFELDVEPSPPKGRAAVAKRRLPRPPCERQQRKRQRRLCEVEECQKFAQARGRCIRHGGGSRCTTPGCQSSAEPPTQHCIRHGGGRRCQHPGCTFSARKPSVLCMTHGGGGSVRRCLQAGCMAGPQCSEHPQYRVCEQPGAGCRKWAQMGTRLCVAHGGGLRCQHHSQCSKAAIGRTRFCKAHGGGLRCSAEGCGKSAVSSRQRPGGLLLCARHGGGRRCQWAHDNDACTRAAVSGTDFCRRHGGGGRRRSTCAVAGCGRSAGPGHAAELLLFCSWHGSGRTCSYKACFKAVAGASDFCTLHGGRRACSQGGCTMGAVGVTGLCFVHGGFRPCIAGAGHCPGRAVGNTDFCEEHTLSSSSHGCSDSPAVPSSPPHPPSVSLLTPVVEGRGMLEGPLEEEQQQQQEEEEEEEEEEEGEEQQKESFPLLSSMCNDDAGNSVGVFSVSEDEEDTPPPVRDDGLC